MFEFVVATLGGSIEMISGLVAVVASSVTEVETVVGVCRIFNVVCSSAVECTVIGCKVDKSVCKVVTTTGMVSVVNSNDVGGMSVFSVFEFVVVTPGGSIVMISGLFAVVSLSVTKVKTVDGVSRIFTVVGSSAVE